MNRDSSARLTISSPLEAHKSHTLVYHTVGVDVGFENPMFACLEIDYEVGTFFNIMFVSGLVKMQYIELLSLQFVWQWHWIKLYEVLQLLIYN